MNLFKYYYIYKIVNKINQKIYIGQHRSNTLSDKYFGSGTYLRRAINKYGKENFEKEIVELCNEYNINEREVYWILQFSSQSPNGYNLKVKSDNINYSWFDIHPDKEKLSKKYKQAIKTYLQTDKAKEYYKNQSEKSKGVNNWFFGKKHTEETKKKMSDIAKLRPPVSEETKKKKSEKLKGHPGYWRGKHHNEEYKQKMRQSCLGKKMTEEQKIKMSQKAKQRPKITCPHCGLSCNVRTTMNRYHFDNCKQKK